MARNKRIRSTSKLTNRKRQKDKKQSARQFAAAQSARKGFIMMAGVVLVVIIAASIALTRERVTLDANNCNTQAPLPGHTIFLIDGTDKVEGQYINRLKERLSHMQSHLPIGEKLTLVRLSGDDEGNPEFATIFSQCNPGMGKQYKGIWESQKIKQAEWTEFFGQPLDNAISELEKLSIGQTSPIIESIDRLTFRSDFQPTMRNRKLVIVSDLMQHTDEVSNYRKTYSYDDYKDRGEPYSDVPLNGVTVDIIYIQRPQIKHYQNKTQKSFWTAYFKNNHATLQEFR